MEDKKRFFFDDEKAEIEDFAESIPVPSDENDEIKPHKIVRYVDVPEKPVETPIEEEEDEVEETEEKKGFISDFFSGVAAGAKTVGENLKGDGKSSDDKSYDSSRVYKTERKAKKETGFMKTLGRLPARTIIGGAALLTALIVVIILCVASSCSKGPGKENESSNHGNLTPGGQAVIETGTDATETDIPLEIPSRKDKFTEAYNKNSDVVGWLYIPGLSDVDAGVCQDTKKYSYNKRDITGKTVSATYWINGAYYTHLRNTFGTDINSLSTNTVIFGHSDLGLTNLAYKNDDPTGPLFSQLFSFKDPSFAQKTPYIYLTTDAGDTVWEVFSVFYNDSSIDGGKALWYIEPEPGAAYQTVLDTMRDRSLYDYEVEVTENDKILTLSTCTVGFGLSSRARYRFVIVAKLVTETDNLVVKNASFKINEDAPVPDTYSEEFQKYILEWNKTGVTE